MSASASCTLTCHESLQHRTVCIMDTLHAAGGWGSIQAKDAGIAFRRASPWSLQDGLSQHPLHEPAAHACDQSGICENVTPVGLV